MKKIITLFAILLVLSNIAKAQDTIVKINGDTIIAKISEINSTEIKYKKFKFQDGPMYVENKSEIKQISYSNGLKEVFAVSEPKKIAPETTSNNDYYNPNETPVPTHKKMDPGGHGKYRYEGRKIGEKEMQAVLLKTKDKQIMGLVQSAKDAKMMQYLGFAAIPVGITGEILMISGISNSYGYSEPGKIIAGGILFVGAFAIPVVSIVNKNKRTRLNKKAVQLYNEKY